MPEKSRGRANVGLCGAVFGVALLLCTTGVRSAPRNEWKAGVAAAVITPEGPMFLSGYGSRREATGKRHDIWVKALALQDARGRRGVLVTSDLVGISKQMYEALVSACRRRFGLTRADLMLTYTHNHCAPVTTNVLPDYYPLQPGEWERVDRYSRLLESKILDTIDAALRDLRPAQLSTSEDLTPFAVNRRNNVEAQVPAVRARGETLKGPSDHSVPVLAVRSTEGKLLAVSFGYACHPTTLGDLQWCGDYPGYAQIAIEAAHPGARALFWTGCGGDQNPLPRRTPELCEKYGRMLADAVERALRSNASPVTPRLRTAMEVIRLDHERRPTEEELRADTTSTNSVRARWAKRMLALPDRDASQPRHTEYGVQAWRLGDRQLLLALGGEAVVDYSLRFKQEYGPSTWVAGYAHDMVGYVPSRRVWREGGYEAEFIYEYGWLAYRWTEDTEDRIAAAVRRLAKRVGIPANRQ
jgi:hypothetical protein